MDIEKLYKMGESKLFKKLNKKQIRTLYLYLFEPNHEYLELLDRFEENCTQEWWEFIIEKIFTIYSPQEIDEILEREKWISL